MKRKVSLSEFYFSLCRWKITSSIIIWRVIDDVSRMVSLRCESSIRLKEAYRLFIESFLLRRVVCAWNMILSSEKCNFSAFACLISIVKHSAHSITTSSNWLYSHSSSSVWGFRVMNETSLDIQLASRLFTFVPGGLNERSHSNFQTQFHSHDISIFIFSSSSEQNSCAAMEQKLETDFGSFADWFASKSAMSAKNWHFTSVSFCCFSWMSGWLWLYLPFNVLYIINDQSRSNLDEAISEMLR